MDALDRREMMFGAGIAALAKDIQGPVTVRNPLTGSGAPGASVGEIGQVYFDVANGVLYGPKTVDGWPSGVSLIGPQGNPGGSNATYESLADVSSRTVPTGTNLVWIAGTSTVGDAGAAAPFVYDATVNAAYVIANPTTSFVDHANRGFRRAPQPSDAITFKNRASASVPRRLNEKTQETEINLNDFGMIPNDPTKAVSNYNAYRAALAFAFSPPLGATTSTSILEGKFRLTLGEGEYFIQGQSPLMFNRTEMTSLPGGYRYRRGFTLEGRGRKSTILTMVSAGTGDLFFYSNADANYPNRTDSASTADFLTFQNLTFRGTVTTVRQESGHKTNGFNFQSTGWEKFINFFNCSFEYLDQFMTVTGSGNADHNRFFGCSLFEIREYFLYLNNDQSVCWGFHGLDLENLRGSGIVIGPYGGGDLSWINGSVVMCPDNVLSGGVEVISGSQTAKAFVTWDNSGIGSGPSSGPGNDKFTFRNLRFEIYNATNRLVKTTRSDLLSYGQIQIVFEDCAMPMAFTDETAATQISSYAAVELENAVDLKFIRCSLHSSFEFRCKKHAPTIEFQSCQYLNPVPITDTNLLSGRCFIDGGTGFIKARNVISQRYVSIGDVSQTIAFDFNKGFQIASDLTCNVQGKDPERGWPVPSRLGSFKVFFPEGSIVTSVLINKPAESVQRPINDYRIEVNNYSNSISYFYTTPQNQNLAVLVKNVFTAPIKISAAPNNYINVSSSGANDGSLFSNKSGGVIFEYI